MPPRTSGAAAVPLAPEEVAELRELFDMLDRDKGGTLSIAEILELMQLLGIRCSVSEVQALVASVDADGSGELDFEEFLKVVAAPQRLPYTQAELLRAFRRFADRGAPPGCICPETLEKALLAYGLKDSGVEPAELSRMVFSMETTESGSWIDFRAAVALLFAGARRQRRGGLQ